MKSYAAIVVGVSAGGLEALSRVFPSLPWDFPLPIVVVQHVAPDSDGYLAAHLKRLGPLDVKEADEKETPRGGTIYVAPANYHLLVERDRTLSLSVDPWVNYARPSIDLLFQSASEAYGSELIGVIMTGANSDGARGLGEIEAAGGLAIVQDPKTAEAASMPSSAIAGTKKPVVLPLEEIAGFLTKVASHE